MTITGIYEGTLNLLKSNNMKTIAEKREIYRPVAAGRGELMPSLSGEQVRGRYY